MVNTSTPKTLGYAIANPPVLDINFLDEKARKNDDKKRGPVLAAILSLVAPDVGHVYAGDAKKGLFLIAIEYGVILLIGIAGLFSSFYGFAALTVFIILSFPRSAWECRQRRSASRTAGAAQDSFPRWSVAMMPLQRIAGADND